MIFSFKTLVFLLAAFVFISCASERYISPTILGPERLGLSVDQPIMGSVFDGRAVQKPKDATSLLQRDLSRMYGSSIKWSGYFSEIPKGQVGVRIRIVTLGATFGSRLISSTAYINSQNSSHGQASGPWGSVVASAVSEQSAIAGSFSGEGWWNGAAWVDIEIQDHRSEKPISFVIPIIAEHRESNMWGYSSGDKAAQIAWERASEMLTRVLDSILRTVQDQD